LRIFTTSALSHMRCIRDVTSGVSFCCGTEHYADLALLTSIIAGASNGRPWLERVSFRGRLPSLHFARWFLSGRRYTRGSCLRRHLPGVVERRLEHAGEWGLKDLGQTLLRSTWAVDFSPTCDRRCTVRKAVRGAIYSRAPIPRHVTPCARSWAIFGASTGFRGRPSRLPLARRLQADGVPIPSYLPN
jgi:hypothetical protein